MLVKTFSRPKTFKEKIISYNLGVSSSFWSWDRITHNLIMSGPERVTGSGDATVWYEEVKDTCSSLR